MERPPHPLDRRRDQDFDRPLDRRALLKAVPATAAVGLGLPPLLTTGAGAAAAPASAQDAPKQGGTVVAALSVEVVSYDPFLAGSNHGYMIARGLYNTLTRLDSDFTPQPELATDWSFSEDGRTLTLNLRQDVTFHSGRPFTSADVLFSFAAAQDAEYAALNRGLVTPISVEAVDDYTVVLSTETPYPAIFDALDGTFIVDSETAVPRFPEVGIGTGPFKQGERIPGEYARFDRYDEYWGGPAPLDAFEVRPIPDSAALALALETRSIDVAWRIGYRDYVRLQDDGGFVVEPGAEAATFYDLTINTTHPVLSDKLVRQALNWAIDRDRFVDAVLLNIVGPTAVPYPSQSIAYDEAQATAYTKDLDRAAALLAEAGHGDGFSFKLMTSSSLNPGLGELAQILQADLATIGVTVEIEDVESATYNERFLPGDFDVAVHTFGRANKDPATLFGGAVVWYTNPETNPTKFDSDTYRELVEQGATTIDPAERREIYHAVTELIQDESFTIPIAQQPRTWAWLPEVRDFAYTLDNMPLWHAVWLDR